MCAMNTASSLKLTHNKTTQESLDSITYPPNEFQHMQHMNQLHPNQLHQFSRANNQHSQPALITHPSQTFSGNQGGIQNMSHEAPLSRVGPSLPSQSVQSHPGFDFAIPYPVQQANSFQTLVNNNQNQLLNAYSTNPLSTQVQPNTPQPISHIPTSSNIPVSTTMTTQNTLRSHNPPN